MTRNRISRIVALYFSATGTTEKIALAVAGAAAKELGVPLRTIDVTTPATRSIVSKTLCNSTSSSGRHAGEQDNVISAEQSGRKYNAENVFRNNDIEVNRIFQGFCSSDLVIFAVPVYIGRVPNLIAPFFKSILGGGAIGIPVMTYGHRNYDDALRELWSIMKEDGFRGPSVSETDSSTHREGFNDSIFEFPIAAAVFPAEHSFSRILGAGRPDASDLKLAEEFGRAVAKAISWSTEENRDKSIAGAERLENGESRNFDNRKAFDSNDGELCSLGNEKVRRIEAGYFTSTEPMRFFKAVNDKGEGFDIRKVKPVTDQKKCTNCGACALMCPMGSIDAGNCSIVNGICIKCGACVKKCPAGAKSFTDAGYLEHLSILERDFTEPRQKPSIFTYFIFLAKESAIGKSTIINTIAPISIAGKTTELVNAEEQHDELHAEATPEEASDTAADASNDLPTI